MDKGDKGESTPRQDSGKLVEEYQKKFNVPKTLIMKWLNVNPQKSQFNKVNDHEDMSWDSSITQTEGSLDPGSSKSIKLDSTKSIQELVEDGENSKPKHTYVSSKFCNKIIKESEQNLPDWEFDENLSDPNPEIKSTDETEEELTLRSTPSEWNISQAEPDKGLAESELIHNPAKDEQKANLPIFVIKKRNIQKVKNMIGNKLAINSCRSLQILKPLKQESKSYHLCFWYWA